MMADPSQAHPREHLRKIIHAEIKSLEESIQAHYGDTSTPLKYRRNALAPISTLPAEVIAAIFSFLRRPAASSPRGKPERDLLRVTHVCHQWREIALEQPLLGSRVDCTNLTLAGVREILARAKNAPLHLEARFHGSHWKKDRFGTFEKELLLHISHIRHLGIGPKTGQVFHLLKILGGLTSNPSCSLTTMSSSEHLPHPGLSLTGNPYLDRPRFDMPIMRWSHNLRSQACQTLPERPPSPAPKQVVPSSSAPLPPSSGPDCPAAKGGATSRRSLPEVVDLLAFDVLNIFRRRWFLSRTNLLTNIISAQKAEDGNISWVEFTPPFHSHLVKCAVALVPHRACPVPMVKRVMFVFILELLNQEGHLAFFELQKGGRKANNAQKEKWRLARKRSRAAKRERDREAAKAAQLPPCERECLTCGRKFQSRKTAKKHKCAAHSKVVRNKEAAATRSSSHPAPPAQLIKPAASFTPPAPTAPTNSSSLPVVTGISLDHAESFRQELAGLFLRSNTIDANVMADMVRELRETYGIERGP